MRGRCKRKEPKESAYEPADGEAEPPAPPGDTVAGLAEPYSPAPSRGVRDLGSRKKVATYPSDHGDKVYLGVRVKMPVKDLLRNVRLAKGWDSQGLQQDKTMTGDKKRVKTRRGRRTTSRKHPTKSLEELAIIVEVLEEDLRSSSTNCSPHQTLSPSCSPVSPELLRPNGYNSDESDEMIPSPQAHTTYSPATAMYHLTLSSFGPMHASFQPPSCNLHQERSMGRHSGPGDERSGPQNLNSSALFWAQLLKEESKLRVVPDAALLAADRNGRTALHKVVCDGKRALAYAIAKRMAALNSLNVKDSDGMTALLLAADLNHNLMVKDLICLGADVNERNNSGKSCLHLSVEKGYIGVLEALKHTMMDGVYVNVEATDNSGMSVLQCASVALKATLHQLENSKSPNHTRIHELRKMQIMETLECLLQMGSYFHTMGSWGVQS